MTGIEAFLGQAQLRCLAIWFPCLIHDFLRPSSAASCPLAAVCGLPVKRYKDSLKKSLQLCNIDPATWEKTAQDRSLWRHSCETGIVLNVNASLICIRREKEEKLASTSLHSLTTAPSVDEDVLPPSDYTHT